MGSPNQGKFNVMVIAGSLVVLVVGSVLIFWSKGYFSTRVDHRKDESRFTKFAEQADGQWEVQAPTALSNTIEQRIRRDVEKYNDPRFDELQTLFNKTKGRHQRGEIDHMAFQQQLISMQQRVSLVEVEVDPELRAAKAKNQQDRDGVE